MPERAAPCAAAAAITPDAKLGDVLARWPELEEVLVGLSPHFAALRNPALRRTVAKVATLRHVAKVSGVELGALVGALRRAAGLAAPAVGDARDDEGPRPAWASPGAATRTHDACAAIAAGEHPLEEVLGSLARLAPGEVYELITPFVPAPLVERARAKGFQTWTDAAIPGQVRTWFARAANDSADERDARARE